MKVSAGAVPWVVETKNCCVMKLPVLSELFHVWQSYLCRTARTLKRRSTPLIWLNKARQLRLFYSNVEYVSMSRVSTPVRAIVYIRWMAVGEAGGSRSPTGDTSKTQHSVPFWPASLLCTLLITLSLHTSLGYWWSQLLGV